MARLPSTSTADAKDRIGTGPWYNSKGELIAQNVADLHSANNKLTGATAFTEKARRRSTSRGHGARPEGQAAHDILTGTNEDGTKNAATCNNWTDGADATAMLAMRTASGATPGELVECDPCVAGLLDGEAAADRRRRLVLLLRDELIARF